MSTSQAYTPETNEHHPDFPFVFLAVPPPEWELYDIPDKTHLRNRALDLAILKRLVRYHTWGFDVTIGERKTKERLLNVLKRLVYNQEPHLRPTWHDFVGRTCDAGPRLLKRRYNALQISRYYPDGMPGQPLRLQPVVHGGVPHHQQQQRQQSHPYQNAYVDGGIITNTAVVPATPIDFESPSSGIIPLSGHHTFCSISGSSPRPLSAGNSFTGSYTTSTPPGPNGPMFQQSMPTQSPLQSSQQNQISPTIPGPITPDISSAPTPMSICTPTRSDQQRTPTPIQPQPTNLATKHAHQAKPSLPLFAVTHIPVSITGEIPSLTYDANGDIYPLRGRGPVSKGVSSLFDCIITVGLLLDIGPASSYCQPDPGWMPQLSHLEKVYLRALTMDWISLSEEESARCAQSFRNICCERLNAVPSNNYSTRGANGNQSVLSRTLADVWRGCTDSFGQFVLRYSEIFRPCPCQGPPQPLKRTLSSSVFTTEACNTRTGRNFDLDSSINQFFQYERPATCLRCGTASHAVLQRQFDALPWRLVIHPDQRVRFLSYSSKQFTVGYMDSQCVLQKTTYRWLGGIYPVILDNQTVYKVFWDDDGAGADGGALRIYDAAQISGLIVGGVHRTQSRGECVPASWWAHGSTPLLFYEKVANPPFEKLAASSCNTMGVGLDGTNNGLDNAAAQSSILPATASPVSGVNAQHDETHVPHSITPSNPLSHTISSFQSNPDELQDQQQSRTPHLDNPNPLHWEPRESCSSPLQDANMDSAPDHSYSSSPHGRESMRVGTPLHFPDLSPSRLDEPIITTTGTEELLSSVANDPDFQNGYSAFLASGFTDVVTTTFSDPLPSSRGNEGCTATDTGERSNSIAPPSSPPMDLSSVGTTALPTSNSLLTQTQMPGDSSLPVEAGISTEPGTVNISSRYQGPEASNGNPAVTNTSEPNWAFNIKTAANIDIGTFDGTLGYSTEDPLAGQRAQQMATQQQVGTQLAGLPHSVSVQPSGTSFRSDNMRHPGAFPANDCAPKRAAEDIQGYGSDQAARKRYKP